MVHGELSHSAMSLSKLVSGQLSSLVLGGAVLTGLYILLGPSLSAGKKKSGAVVGLVNQGNTCYINTVLQALASCHTFYYWLDLEDCTINDRRSRKLRPVTKTLMEIMKILNNMCSTVSDPYNPGYLLSCLRSHGWLINVEEQDAHEMLHVLMTTLEEELPDTSSRNKPSHASLLDISNIEDEDEEIEEDGRLRSLMRGMSLPPESRVSLRQIRSTASMSRDSSPKSQRRRSGVFTKQGEELSSCVVSSFTKPNNQSPFTGLLSSKLTHNNGQTSPVNYSRFDNITLNLPEHSGGQVSLYSLLWTFVSKETVQAEDQRTNLTKQISFGKLPECLCFHIQRTGFSNGHGAYKRHDFVDFPEHLNMERFTHASQAGLQKLNFSSLGERTNVNKYQYLFTLRAVVVHSGGIHSGHYVTYRKGPLSMGSKSSSKWYFTSDASVKPVQYSEVSKAPAYMLFYERISEEM